MSSSMCHSQMTLTSDPEKFRNPPWWNRRTRLERRLCFLSVTFLLMLSMMAAALTFVGHLYQKSLDARQQAYFPASAERLTNQNNTQDVCLSRGCVQAAAAVLSNIDESVDPCDNFYQFACGGWLSRHTISEDKSSVSVFSVVQDDLNMKLRILLEKPLNGSEPYFIKMIKNMFDSCLDLKKIEDAGSKPLESVLKSMGGWPVVEGKAWNELEFDWIDTLIKFRKLGYSHDILMDLSVTADYRNNSFHIIDLDQTSLGMPDRTYFLRGLNDSSTAAYFKLMVKTASALGADELYAEKELQKSLNFETALANFSLPREERRNISKLYNKFTVKQLKELAPKVDWIKYFNELLNEKISEEEPVIVGVPNFVVNFAKFISETEKRVIANYMIWRLVGQSLSMLSKTWRNIAHEYTAVITGKGQEEPRWEQCLSSLTGSLGIALSSYYVRQYFKDDSRDKKYHMNEHLPFHTRHREHKGNHSHYSNKGHENNHRNTKQSKRNHHRTTKQNKKIHHGSTRQNKKNHHNIEKEKKTQQVIKEHKDIYHNAKKHKKKYYNTKNLKNNLHNKKKNQNVHHDDEMHKTDNDENKSQIINHSYENYAHSEESKALEMVQYIHKEFAKILDSVDWMDKGTKDQAKEKAQNIKTYIGYPPELLNNSKVSELYQNLSLTHESYFDNILRVRKWSTDYAFEQLRKPNIKGDWKKHARAAVVNAFYNSIENSIEFPAGILQNAFFSKDRPQYMNFGAIGFVIGHEITHGFDDRGRQFDKDGNNVNWWDETTDQNFKEKARCMIEQYSNYTVEENGMKVNGINTQGENIADNGGLKEAYRAYHAYMEENGVEASLPGLKYSAGQLFWISAANVWCSKYRPEVLKLRIISGAHSPPKFRVIGPVSNLPEFSKEFHCPLGSPMNPHEKCHVW